MGDQAPTKLLKYTRDGSCYELYAKKILNQVGLKKTAFDMFVPVTLLAFLGLSGVSRHCRRELGKRIRLTIGAKAFSHSPLITVEREAVVLPAERPI